MTRRPAGGELLFFFFSTPELNDFSDVDTFCYRITPGGENNRVAVLIHPGNQNDLVN